MRNPCTLLVFLSILALCVPIIPVVADEDATVRQRRLGGPSTRIINGQDARRGRFPWWVFLRGPAECGGDACGGALIAPDLVLTAAHCGGCISRGEIGKYDTSDRQEGGPIRPIESSHPHPNWEGVIPNNDIMIVKLDGIVANAQPIRLNFDENVPSQTGETLLMLGLGSITDGVNEPVQRATILQEAPTEYFAFEDCAVATDPTTGATFGVSPQQTSVREDWFCTILNEPERYAHCFGDSGGPIIIEGSSASEDLLVATISGASVMCGNIYLPDLNQRVSFHTDWIVETGCEISAAPPAEWGCPQAPAPEPGAPTSPPVAPTNSPVDLTNPPSVAPMPSPASPGATSPPNGPPSPPPTTVAEPGIDDEDPLIPVYVIIEFDDSPRDIGWFIADENYERFRVGVPPGTYDADQERVEVVVYVQAGQTYMFTIEDRIGNGLGGSPAETSAGTYEVALGPGHGGTTLVTGGGNFGSDQTTFFTVPPR